MSKCVQENMQLCYLLHSQEETDFSPAIRRSPDMGRKLQQAKSPFPEAERSIIMRETRNTRSRWKEILQNPQFQEQVQFLHVQMSKASAGCLSIPACPFRLELGVMHLDVCTSTSMSACLGYSGAVLDNTFVHTFMRV